MRKTAFSTAIFGICSSALLLIGLSSLREPIPVLAQNRSSGTSARSADTLAYASDAEDFALRTDEGATTNDPFNGAWDTGPVPDDPLAARESASSAGSTDPASGYRYYYRFVPQDEDFVWIEDSDGWQPKTHYAGDSENIDLYDSPRDQLTDLPESATPSLEQQPLESAPYSFVDEYSPEEAARYEMAQENRSEESSSSQLEIAEDGYFPWYQKYYYLMGNQEHVGTRPNLCRVEEEKTAEPTPAPATDPSGDATDGPGYSFDGRTWEPDYEADVAAAWLFAASRRLTGADEAAERQLAEMSDNSAQEEMESLPDEAYEEWDVYSEMTDPAWEVISDESGMMPSDENAEEQLESHQDVMPGEEEHFSPDALEDSGEYESYDDTMEYNESLTPEEPAAPEDETTWTIVNPEPIVSSSANSDDGSPSTPLIFDTPWHGEPGENFFWVESESVPDNATTVEESAESEHMGSSDDWNSGGWDSGSAWDVDLPGYRINKEIPAVDYSQSTQKEDQNELDGTTDPALEVGNFHEGQEETPADAGSAPLDEAMDEPLPDAIYTGEYLEGSYEWEKPSLQENGLETDVAEPVGSQAVPADDEGVSLERVLRGLAAATIGAFPRLALRDLSLEIPANIE